MGHGNPFTLLAAGALFGATTAPASAAPTASTPPATASARLARPVSMTWTSDLDFAALSVTSAGTATINANTGAMTTTGGVLRAGGTPSAAHFEIVAARAALIIVTIPNTAVTIRRVGGTATMTVSNWTLDGSWLRIIPTRGVLEMAVGARLNVNVNQPEGVYVGQFDVRVDYF